MVQPTHFYGSKIERTLKNDEHFEKCKEQLMPFKLQRRTGVITA